MPVPRLNRRTVVVTAALVPGAVALTGCKDDAASGAGTPGTKGAVNGTPTAPGPTEETPTVDPAVVAALSTAATLVTQLSLGFAGVSRKFPALRTQLAAGAKYHVSHLTKLKETAGVAPAATKAPAVASTAVAALLALSKQEKAAAIAHAAAAAKLSGAPARLLAEIAASEIQLSSTLTPKKKDAS
ncbi:cell division protein FtsK [Kribbella sp. NBC_00482]|uniref:cell division protein FtsK n=1 Tax=Kribbella sp. NBC_00482 TaxID=2975968 RepID=UPI002E174A05